MKSKTPLQVYTALYICIITVFLKNFHQKTFGTSPLSTLGVQRNEITIIDNVVHVDYYTTMHENHYSTGVKNEYCTMLLCSSISYEERSTITQTASAVYSRIAWTFTMSFVSVKHMRRRRSECKSISCVFTDAW